MTPQVLPRPTLDVASGVEGPSKAWSPAGDAVVFIVVEYVGLETCEALLPNITSDLANAVDVEDRGREMLGSRAVRDAVRPVDPDLVADLAAEQRIAGYTQRLRLRIKQRVLDRTERLPHHATGARPGDVAKILTDMLVMHCALADEAVLDLVDRRLDARRAEILIELAPANNPVFSGNLQEIVVSPGVAARKGLDLADDGLLRHDILDLYWELMGWWAGRAVRYTERKPSAAPMDGHWNSELARGYGISTGETQTGYLTILAMRFAASSKATLELTCPARARATSSARICWVASERGLRIRHILPFAATSYDCWSEL